MHPADNMLFLAKTNFLLVYRYSVVYKYHRKTLVCALLLVLNLKKYVTSNFNKKLKTSDAQQMGSWNTVEEHSIITLFE